MRTHAVQIAILGNGPIARSLALALADIPIDMMMLDTFPRQQARPPQPDRTVALALGTRRLLQDLQVPLPLQGSAAIRTVQITQQGAPSRVRLEAQLLGSPEGILGEVAGLDHLEGALETALGCCPNLVQMPAGPVQDLQWHPDRVTLKWPELRVEAELVVVADGGHGHLQNLAHLQRLGWDHNRHAIVSTVTPREKICGIAYEHFLDSGPLAFLPIGDGQFSIVWSLRPEDASRILALPEGPFLEALNRQRPSGLPPLVGSGPRSVYPLFFQRLWAQPQQRMALVGNAAQTIHPLAGQGYNLGLRDVITLAALLRRAAAGAEDMGNAGLLTDYARIRRRDRLETIAFTETMNRLFGTRLLPLRLVRAAALAALERLPAIKRDLAARLAGIDLPAASTIPDLITEPRHV
jgi:2-octaprenyl-6-methoxyphenol hydroxylase